MISTNFLPNEPVPPVISTVASRQSIDSTSSVFILTARKNQVKAQYTLPWQEDRDESSRVYLMPSRQIVTPALPNKDCRIVSTCIQPIHQTGTDSHHTPLPRHPVAALRLAPQSSQFRTPNPSRRPTQAERAAKMGKKVNGRKRQCWVDTNGFLLRVL